VYIYKKIPNILSFLFLLIYLCVKFFFFNLQLGVYEFALTFNKYHVDKSPFRILVTEGHLPYSSNPSQQSNKDRFLRRDISVGNESKSEAPPDYEINNRSGIKFNTTLNKIMEETILDTENENKDVISAATLTHVNAITTTDTSESDSSGESRTSLIFFKTSFCRFFHKL